jgi:hypothetical protein
MCEVKEVKRSPSPTPPALARERRREKRVKNLPLTSMLLDFSCTIFLWLQSFIKLGSKGIKKVFNKQNFFGFFFSA